jgi:hypothetical protein
LGFDDGAALALVDELVLFDADADVLGAVLVSEPQARQHYCEGRGDRCGSGDCGRSHELNSCRW